MQFPFLRPLDKSLFRDGVEKIMNFLYFESFSIWELSFAAFDSINGFQFTPITRFKFAARWET